MDQMEKYRRAETLRLVEWIRNHHDDWRSICFALKEEDMLLPEECKEIIRSLRNNGFYQLLVVFAYSNNDCFHKAIESSILSELKRKWNDEIFDKTLDTLLDNIGRL